MERRLKGGMRRWGMINDLSGRCAAVVQSIGAQAAIGLASRRHRKASINVGASVVRVMGSRAGLDYPSVVGLHAIGRRL